jgi:hypothetical protein
MIHYNRLPIDLITSASQQTPVILVCKGRKDSLDALADNSLRYTPECYKLPASFLYRNFKARAFT